MPLSSTQKAFAQLHISIFLAGFTGILGKLITLSEGLLVWYRMIFTLIIFGLYLLLRNKLEKVRFIDICKIGFTGILIALHWVFFYGSIKLSNVSIGVVCFSLVGFFTSLLEPLVLRSRFSLRELVFSLLAVLGVSLIFSFDVRYRQGIIVGIIAAFLAALHTVSIKKLCPNYSANTTVLYQMFGGVVALSLLLPWYIHTFDITYLIPSTNDIVLLLCLSVFCTIFMFFLYIESLRYISAFTVMLSYNLEPVYSIFLAIAFLGEGRELDGIFYVGIFCIALSVGLQSWYVMRTQKGLPPKQISTT